MKRKAFRRAGFILGIALVSLVSVQTVAGKDSHRPQKSKRPLTVQVNPLFAIEGSPIQAIIRVMPSPENRLLRITVDSENYFRSSDLQLDGENAAITHYLPLNSLPAGEYEFVAVVYGSNGERARSLEGFRLYPKTPSGD